MFYCLNVQVYVLHGDLLLSSLVALSFGQFIVLLVPAAAAAHKY